MKYPILLLILSVFFSCRDIVSVEIKDLNRRQSIEVLCSGKNPIKGEVKYNSSSSDTLYLVIHGDKGFFLKEVIPPNSKGMLKIDWYSSKMLVEYKPKHNHHYTGDLKLDLSCF